MKNRVLFNIISDNTEMLPIYVESVSDDWQQQIAIRDSGFPCHQISVCLSGSGIFEVSGKSYIIKQGDFFFFRKDIPHRYYPTNENWRICWTAFDGNGCEAILNYLNAADKCTGTASYQIAKNLTTLIYNNAESENYFKASFLLQELLFAVFNDNKKVNRTQLAVEYIKTNYSRDIQLSELASLYNFGETYFCRMFKKEMKLTPIEYINQYRVNMSKSFLMNEKYSIRQIAELCGFRSLEYFCAVFKKSEGCTATDFRKLCGIYEKNNVNY